jgi:Helix-turn-helix domain
LDKWRLAQEIFGDPKLSPTAKVVAGVLLNCLNCRTGKCCPRLAYLGARIGRERRAISAAITQLRQRGWLTRRGRRGSSIYHFAFDRLQQDGVQETASHEPADEQEPAYLDVQDSAHEDAQETAHLNTWNVESGNGNQGVVSPGEPSSVKTVKRDIRLGKGILMVDWDRAWQNWCIRAVEFADARRSTNAHSRRSLVAGLLPADCPSQWGQS